jgi:hypothetical protein
MMVLVEETVVSVEKMMVLEEETVVLVEEMMVLAEEVVELQLQLQLYHLKHKIIRLSNDEFLLILLIYSTYFYSLLIYIKRH